MDHDGHDYFVRLEDALEAAGMAWWEMELPSGVVFFSENKTRMLGYNRDDFLHYKAFTDLLHPEDYPKAMKAMQDHIEGKAEYYEIRYRIKASNGEYRTFFDKGKIVWRKDSNFKIAGVVVDVTDSNFGE